MGSSASITRTVSSLNRNEYMAAIITLKTSVYILNNSLIDLWSEIDQIDIQFPSNQQVYIRVVTEMDALLAKFQQTNIALLETLNNRPVEHYWAKYIKRCRKCRDEIIELQRRQTEGDAELKDYLKQCRRYRRQCPDDKVELARLVKIQQKINKEAIDLRFEKEQYYKSFYVSDIDIKKIDVRAVELLTASKVYWGKMGVTDDDDKKHEEIRDENGFIVESRSPAARVY